MTEDQSRLSMIYEEERPWGKFRRFTDNEISTVKILTVTPGCRLSFQYHHLRNELWRVLKTGVFIELEYPDGRKESLNDLKVGDEVFIEKETKHRLGCRSDVSEPGEILEISFGFFDENDIVRLNDDFGRV